MNTIEITQTINLAELLEKVSRLETGLTFIGIVFGLAIVLLCGFNIYILERIRDD